MVKREYPSISRIVGHSVEVNTPEDMKYFCSSSIKIETYEAQVKHDFDKGLAYCMSWVCVSPCGNFPSPQKYNWARNTW